MVGDAPQQVLISAQNAQSTWLPVWNNTSGKLEAYLVLEPADESPQVGSRWRFGNNSLEATYGLQAGDSLALRSRFAV